MLKKINLTLATLTLCNAFSFDSRFDRLHPLDSTSLVFEEKVSYIKQKRRSKAFALSTERIDRPIILDFICDMDAPTCAKAELATMNALLFISDLLVLKRAITVQARYTRFCDETDAQDCDRTNLGYASSSSNWFVNATEAKSGIWYPQAIAKQLLDEDRDWHPYDIQATFNSDNHPDGLPRFWFEGDSSIRKNQYCFEYVVLHEALHGLGILTYFSNSLKEGNIISPAMIYEVHISKDIETLHMKDALPHSIFDTLVSSTQDDRTLTYFYNQFVSETTTKRSLPDIEWRTRFKDTPAYASLQALHSLSTTSKLEIKLPPLNDQQRTAYTLAGIPFGDDDRIQLHASYSPFRESSSICHFDQKRYTDTEDFLMRPEATAGKTLKSLTKRHKFPIGPLTIRLLSALGYEITNQPLRMYGNSDRGLATQSTLALIICILLSSIL